MKFSGRKKGILITVTAVLLLVLLVRYIIAENTVFYKPHYEKKNLSTIISEKNYDEVFLQTGVAPSVAKEIAESGNTAFLEELQEAYFSEPDIKKKYVAFPVTIEERTAGNIIPLIPLKKGDIIVTFNTRTLDWRHGHSAIVLDKDGNYVLEHMSIGKNSVIAYSQYWGAYPGFMVLRHADEKVGEAAAKYAAEKLVGIPYNLFTGVIKKDKTGEDNPSSHCSHIVWQAYMSQGVDIDANGGFLVSPRDIATSENLSVVQIYGINPKDFIK